MGRVIHVDPLDPVVRREVRKGKLGNVTVSIILLCHVREGVPQEIPVDALARKRDVDPGPGSDTVGAQNLRVVLQNVREVLVEDIGDVSEI